MGQRISVKAADGHSYDAYAASPAGKPRGAVVVLQEIFGVTGHIRAITDEYAAHGYQAIAPALFDRARSGVELDYTDIAQGRELVTGLDPNQTLLDIRAAIASVASAGKVATVGYCWGGALSYGAACHLPLSAAVCYYGSRIGSMLDHTPKCPTLFHFGERDASIPPEMIDRIKRAYPMGVYYTYPAGHGFNCTERADFDAPSARLALDRTLDFLSRHLA